MQGEKLLTSKEVQHRTGLHRQTIWRLESNGDFPKKRQITPGRVAYVESEIQGWIDGRAALVD